MLISAISDVHLGVNRFRKMFGGHNAFSQFNNLAFSTALSIAAKKSSHMIIGGDLFERHNPNVNDILFAKKSFEENELEYHVLGGNHDYNQYSFNGGYHVFDLIEAPGSFEEMNNGFGRVNVYYSDISINILAEKTVGGKNFPVTVELGDLEELSNNPVEGLELGALVVHMPYKTLTAENFGRVNKWRSVYKKWISELPAILVIHGQVELDRNSGIEEDYALPRIVATRFDLVIAGHVHMPILLETPEMTILTPGSTIVSSKASEETTPPSVYFYDTKTREISREKIGVKPQVRSILTSNINGVLERISAQTEYKSDIVSIKYDGKTQDIDERLYKAAMQHCLNLSIETVDIFDDNPVEEVLEFWSFVEQNYPQFRDEFKTVVEKGSHD